MYHPVRSARSRVADTPRSRAHRRARISRALLADDAEEQVDAARVSRVHVEVTCLWKKSTTDRSAAAPRARRTIYGHPLVRIDVFGQRGDRLERALDERRLDEADQRRTTSRPDPTHGWQRYRGLPDVGLPGMVRPPASLPVWKPGCDGVVGDRLCPRPFDCCGGRLVLRGAAPRPSRLSAA